MYDLDKIYGPKKLSNGKITLGEKNIKFGEDTLFINERTYPLSTSLIGLLLVFQII